MKRTFGWILVVALALGVGAGLAWQWRTTELLRIELDALREAAGEQSQLRADNERLRRERPPPAELERIRTDHAAVLKLRMELEALRAKSEGR
jgi:hypothetical protein